MTNSKTLLITGANRGIGLALAQQYHAKGWKVLATARDPDHAEELAEVSDEIYPVDVRYPDQISDLANKLQGVTIDLLINNAGIMNKDKDDVSPEPIVQQFLTNSLGPLLVSKALLPNLLQSDEPRIINITSSMGSIDENTSGGYYGYRASKSALNSFFKSWSIDYEEVPVLLAHPGFVQSDMNKGQGEISVGDCAAKLVSLFDDFTEKPQAESRFKSGQYVHREGWSMKW